MAVRLILKLPGPAVTTAGRTQETFVAERNLPHRTHELVKLSYEYLYYEPPLARSPLDENMIYKVRAFRDETCDESLAGIGQELGLAESSVRQALGVQGSEIILRCYRTTPADYLSVRRSKGE